MAVPLLDLKAQYAGIADEIARKMEGVIEAQHFIMGPAVDAFESEIGEYLQVEHAIGCASGTDALLLSLKALELEPGAEVILPAFTFFASAGAVWNAGLRPVFIDIDPATFNVTAELIEPAITDRTGAIMPVHLFGQMADMSPILELARARGLAVIEDAAQAIGAYQDVNGQRKPAGTLGTAGCFSFFPSKNLGGFGDGGLITTSDDALADRLRKLRVHGGRRMYEHEMVGTNSRLDALQAAVLSAKLPHLEGWVEARRRNAAWYSRELAELDGVTLPVTAEGNTHAFNQFTIRSDRRDELKAYLDERGIGSAVYYPLGLHLQACFAELGYSEGDLPETERATSEVLSLPVYPELPEGQRAEVVAAIREFAAAGVR